MSDISASIQIIQQSRARLTMSDLAALSNPSPFFEFNDHDKWFYSVICDGEFEGKTLEGNLICVTASLPNQAEDLAMQGLEESINHFREYLATGKIETEQRLIL